MKKIIIPALAKMITGQRSVKKIFSLVACVAFQVTFAQANTMEARLATTELNHNQSYYETLGQLFAQGSLPSLNRISNVAWSGRCFTEDAPSNPTNAGYIFRKDKNADVGPLGNNQIAFEAISYWSRAEIPSYYDGMSVIQVMKTLPDIKFFPAIAETDSVKLVLSGEVEVVTSRLKVSGEYLLEELTNNFGMKARCYYFIPKLQR